MKRILLLSLIFFSALPAFAESRAFQSDIDQDAYNFVKKSCHDLVHEGSIYFRQRVSLLTVDLDINNIHREFIHLGHGDQLGLSHRLNRMLKSEGYYSALRECFPQNQRAQNTYTLKLIALDLGGTLDAVILGVSGGLLISKGIAKLTTLGMRRLSLRALRPWQKRATLAGVAIPLSAPGAYQVYTYKRDERAAEEKWDQLDNAYITNVANRFNQYKEIIQELELAQTNQNRSQMEVLELLSESLRGELLFHCDNLPVHNNQEDYKTLTEQCRHLK